MANVGFLTTWGVTACCVLLGLSAAACNSDADGSTATTAAKRATTSTTTTAPERPASTTTTAYDPAAVEGQVEAAYLKSWDVYAEAVYNLELDEKALSGSFAERSLGLRRDEIRDRIGERRAALVRVDHDYQISVVDPTTAAVVDHFVNHQVLINADTKEPIEEDPNELLLVNFQMKRIGETWRVTLIQKLDS